MTNFLSNDLIGYIFGIDFFLTLLKLSKNISLNLCILIQANYVYFNYYLLYSI